MRGVQVTLSEVAYALRSCEYLVSELREVERSLEQVSEVDPLQDAMLETAADQAASSLKHQLDHAARVAEHWQRQIGDVLG
ncbi:hypothetical protein [Streptomyces sp. NPDC051554]|uniref:hypothetical protein n=1 Tax=Streptomyces sp. NPDC051554 TaxID=3365656 RepID=UPI0037B70E04